jgi:hypothetical protein
MLANHYDRFHSWLSPYLSSFHGLFNGSLSGVSDGGSKGSTSSFDVVVDSSILHLQQTMQGAAEIIVKINEDFSPRT